MLSKKILSALDEQVAREFEASHAYLSLSCWAENACYPGFAKYLRKQANDERDHGLKIIDYILDQNDEAVVPAVKSPAKKFAAILDAMRQVKTQEAEITKRICDMVTLCCEERDHQTAEFLNWFLKEQVEEEKSAYTWVCRLEQAGSNAAAIMLLDHEAGES